VSRLGGQFAEKESQEKRTRQSVSSLSCCKWTILLNGLEAV